MNSWIDVVAVAVILSRTSLFLSTHSSFVGIYFIVNASKRDRTNVTGDDCKIDRTNRDRLKIGYEIKWNLCFCESKIFPNTKEKYYVFSNMQSDIGAHWILFSTIKKWNHMIFVLLWNMFWGSTDSEFSITEMIDENREMNWKNTSHETNEIDFGSRKKEKQIQRKIYEKELVDSVLRWNHRRA